MTDAVRALVTGAAGQDGTYLLDRLLADGVEVHGMVHSLASADSLVGRFPGVEFHVADIADSQSVASLVSEVKPTSIYNLAGITSVAKSWESPIETGDVLGIGPLRLLEAAWREFEKSGGPVHLLQASSAEMFGDAAETPQRETTNRRPVSPYGAAKSFAHEMVNVYRARGMHASTAILYNHESPRRPESFVARKVALAAARISLGLQETVTLGNIDVSRDWGYAPDYVDAMVRISAQPLPGDFIVATGESHTVRDFVGEAFAVAGVTDWADRVLIDPALYRPADPRSLVGDPSALRSIGWQPSISFHELVRIMVTAELDALSSGDEVVR